MEIASMFVIGVLLLILGIFNMRGHINSIHWYHRTRVTEENKMKYGKTVGIGTVIIGAGIILSAILGMLEFNIIDGYATFVAVLVGLSFITYGQIKYNKGFF